MAVGTDPRYRSLAALAAAEIGAPASDDVLRAITAQWQCEQPADAWPPVHDNPGYVTAGAMHSVGEPASSATSQPGVGFLAQYASPEDGARAYGRLIGRASRYQAAQTALQAGDGATFLHAVTTAGYGTRYSCAITAYRSNGGAVAAAPGGSGSGGIVLAVFGARLAGTCATVTILEPANPTESKIIPIPRASIMDPCTVCPTGWAEAVVTVGPIQFLQGFVPPSDLPPNTRNACVAGDVKVGDHPGVDQAAGAAGDALTGAASAILAGLVGALSPLLFLGLFLAMILLGLFVIATSSDASEG